MKHIYLIVLFVSFVVSEDYYEYLGVNQQATDREIRQAFKKKALVLHPDKNQNDPESHEKFLKLNRIYEVLKDPKLRKKYDDYGEEGLEEKPRGNSYHSWNYYHENFGIYDDDHPEIVTLTQTDFDQLSSSSVWFINYYSPMCSHCHTIAPVWRKLAKKLFGVVRFGAINCEDSFSLCRTEKLATGFPSLILYPKHIKFQGPKTYEHLFAFVMDQLDQEPDFELTSSNLKKNLNLCSQKPWLIIDRGEKDLVDFIFYRTQLKSIFKNMLCLGEIDCDLDKLVCENLGFPSVPKFYKDSEALGNFSGVSIEGADFQEFTNNVVQLLPRVPSLTSQTYLELRENVSNEPKSQPLLLIFTSGEDIDLEIKKLPALLPSVTIRQVSCIEMRQECSDLFVFKTPSFILFKPGGGYEVHQGRSIAEDVAAFASEATLADKFQTFTPREFHSALSSGETVMVDFFAPWCPPCMKLLPAFKKASRILDFTMKFGSVDCTIHSKLCSQNNINSYPTLILYNQSRPHQMKGLHSASEIVDFVKDTLTPTVIKLDEGTFYEKVFRKGPNEIWIVDYFANWCGPCLEMAPQYRKFARDVKDIPNVYVASIDCASYPTVCQQQGLRGYPTIRLYSGDNHGTHQYRQFDGWNRNAETFRHWLFESLPSSVALLNDESFEKMLRSPDPSLVYFFLPNCRPCINFSPIYNQIAMELEKDIYIAKINCQTYNWICRAANVHQYPTVQYYKGLPGGRQSAVGTELYDTGKQQVIDYVRRRIRRDKQHDEL